MTSIFKTLWLEATWPAYLSFYKGAHLRAIIRQMRIESHLKVLERSPAFQGSPELKKWRVRHSHQTHVVDAISQKLEYFEAHPWTGGADLSVGSTIALLAVICILAMAAALAIAATFLRFTDR